MKSKESNSKKSVSYQKKDGRGHARASFFWYDSNRDLKACFLVTHVKYALILQDILPQLEAHIRRQSETLGVQYISTTDVVQNIPVTITMQHNGNFSCYCIAKQG